MYQKYLFPLLSVFFLFFSLLLPQHVLAMPKGGSANDGPVSTGTVIETMNTASYTYMLIKSADGQKWVAIPEATVKKGSTVTYADGMVMKNFKSSSLNRTFDSIIFSRGLVQQTGDTTPVKPSSDNSFSSAVQAENNQSQPAPAMASSGGSTGAIVPFEEISVDKVNAENGYSVEEIFTQAEALNGKKVQVRGKVVKFNPSIMGRNWVHLQDGTGNPLHNTHDLVITTDETVPLHATVTVEGIVAAKKDFGAGYKYAVIIEKAKTIK